MTYKVEIDSRRCPGCDRCREMKKDDRICVDIPECSVLYGDSCGVVRKTQVPCNGCYQCVGVCPVGGTISITRA